MIEWTNTRVIVKKSSSDVSPVARYSTSKMLFMWSAGCWARNEWYIFVPRKRWLAQILKTPIWTFWISTTRSAQAVEPTCIGVFWCPEFNSAFGFHWILLYISTAIPRHKPKSELDPFWFLRIQCFLKPTTVTTEIYVITILRYYVNI